MAPLWRLVPHKPWQRELKKKWAELAAGKYDWAQLAMHLWPERVVPKCAEDRSLAIAHGLEDVFWVEDEDGKWQRATSRPTERRRPHSASARRPQPKTHSGRSRESAVRLPLRPARREARRTPGGRLLRPAGANSRRSSTASSRTSAPGRTACTACSFVSGRRSSRATTAPSSPFERRSSRRSLRTSRIHC